jgi:hypothetical protein
MRREPSISDPFDRRGRSHTFAEGRHGGSRERAAFEGGEAEND